MRSKKLNRAVLRSLPVLFPIFCSVNALAQSDEQSATDTEERTLEVITVTARRIEESIKEAPVSVSVLEGQALERQGIDRFDQVLQQVPNASQAGGIGGTLQGLISIRGISTLVRFVGVETGVGFYVDGVYIGRPENFNQDLLDIDRIEVLRGPQGAVFGKNTIAGAINIITKKPDEYTEGLAELQVGDYSHRRLRGYLAGELTNNLYGSFSGSYHERDGYVENAFAGADDLDDADIKSGRVKLRYQPTQDYELLFSADYLTDRGKPAFFEVTDVAFLEDETENTPYTVNADQPNSLDRDIWGLSLVAKANFEAGRLETIIAHRDTEFDAALDDDKLPVRYFVDSWGSETDFSSFESRYLSSFGEHIDYNLGVYYFTQDADNVSNFALGDFLTGVPGVEPPIDLTSYVNTDSWSLFFNTISQLNSRLSLEVGGRYVDEEKEASHIQIDQTGIFGTTDFATKRSDSNFSPIISLRYLLSEDTTLYTRYAEGFKSAGFNMDFISSNSNLEVEPEEAKSLEVGAKLSLFSGMMDISFASFYTDYENLQLAQIESGGVSLNNAAEAEISGAEMEFTALVGDYYDIYGSLGYLDATYDDFPGCPSAGANPELPLSNCTGNYLNLAPQWSATFGAQMVYPLAGSNWELVARIDWNYQSEVYFEPQNEARLSGNDRQLTNIRLGLIDEQWEVFLWANNFFEKEYITYADDRSAIGINTTSAFGEPRTYGATFRYKFSG